MIHKRIDNIHTEAAEGRRMPRGTYLGFAIGAESHHPELLVRIPGLPDQQVSVGIPLILETPFTGSPELLPVRKVVLQVDDGAGTATASSLHAWKSIAHCIGIKCASEFVYAVPSKLQPYSINFSAGSDGGFANINVMLLPFAGRSRCMIAFEGTAEAAAIWGGLYDESPVDDTGSRLVFQTPDSLSSAELATAATDDHLVIEDLDTYDSLMVTLGDGTSFGTSVLVRLI